MGKRQLNAQHQPHKNEASLISAGKIFLSIL
jgi:hypothetical protein